MALENVMRVDGGHVVGPPSMPDTYPAEKVIMSDGVTSVEDAVDDHNTLVTYYKADLIDETTKNSNITLNIFNITRIKNLPIGRLQVTFKPSVSVGASGLSLGTLKGDFFVGSRPVLSCVDDYDGSPGAAIYFTASPNVVKAYSCEANHLYYLDAFVLLKDF